jgi:hypothetical protein
MGYRKDIDWAIVSSEELIENSDKINYIPASSALDMISDIEDKINDIKNELKPFIVLTELDEIYDKLEKLSKDLY